jgi:hypothetical protein
MDPALLLLLALAGGMTLGYLLPHGSHVAPASFVPRMVPEDDGIFSTEASATTYVESEPNTLTATHPDLHVTAGPAARSPRHPCWIIWGQEVLGESKQFYRIDADLPRAELVIWPGHRCGTTMPEASFRPAVHLDLCAYDEFWHNPTSKTG